MNMQIKLNRRLILAGLIAGLALSIANVAFAGATVKDVETAVKINHDYQQGERLIREVVADNPNDARDHYIYSQILRHNGKHDDAVHEMAEAKRLDPAFSFDKNPRHVESYAASLNSEGNAQVPPARIAPSYVPPETIVEQPPLPEQHKSGHTLLWVVMILGVLGVAGYFFYRRTQEHDRLEDEERMKVARQDQLKTASELLESVKPLKLDIRMASPPNPALLAEVEDAERELVSLIERLGKSPVAQSEIDRHVENFAHLRRKFEGKPDPVAAPEPEYEHAPNSLAPGFGQQGAAPTVYQQQFPQTVYVENNSGGMGGVGGLLTGMALGSMMGGRHDREVIREVREVPERRYEEDRSGGGGESDIDFGNDGGGVDFGGSDDS